MRIEKKDKQISIVCWILHGDDTFVIRHTVKRIMIILSLMCHLYVAVILCYKEYIAKGHTKHTNIEDKSRKQV